MKRSNVRPIADHLFRDIESPMYVLGQEQCGIMMCRNRRGRVVPYKVKGTDKDLLLKPMDKLDRLKSWNFTKNNTIIVDDSPIKHFMNYSSQVVLLDTWSYNGDGVADNYLVTELLPWIRRLHLARPRSLYPWRKDNKFGRPTLLEEPDQTLMDDLEKAMEESNSLYDEWRALNPRCPTRFEDSIVPSHWHVEMPDLEQEE